MPAGVGHLPLLTAVPMLRDTPGVCGTGCACGSIRRRSSDDQGRIESGEVFPEEIKQALDAAKVVLVLIAPGWQRILAERAEGPGIDWVRREVEIALERRLQPESRTAASSWRWRPRTAPPFSCAATGCGRSWRGSIRKR